jgi:hypothetical protein
MLAAHYSSQQSTEMTEPDLVRDAALRPRLRSPRDTYFRSDKQMFGAKQQVSRGRQVPLLICPI